MNIAHLMLLGLIPSAAPSDGAVESVPSEFRVPPRYQDTAAEVPKWSGSFNLGANFAEGNSVNYTATAAFDAEKRTEEVRKSVDLFWNYSRTRDRNTPASNAELTQHRFGGKVQYDRYITEKAYWLANVGAEVDKPADLELRYYVGGGAGYQFWEEEDTKFRAEAGLVFFSESFDDSSDDEDSISLRAAYDYARKLSDTTNFEQALQVFPSLEELEDFYGRVDNQVKIDMSENMFANLRYIFAYDNTPASGAKRRDHQLIVGVGWSF